MREWRQRGEIVVWSLHFFERSHGKRRLHRRDQTTESGGTVGIESGIPVWVSERYSGKWNSQVGEEHAERLSGEERRKQEERGERVAGGHWKSDARCVFLRGATAGSFLRRGLRNQRLDFGHGTAWAEREERTLYCSSLFTALPFSLSQGKNVCSGPRHTRSFAARGTSPALSIDLSFFMQTVCC